MDVPVGERFFLETKYVRGKKITPTRIVSKPSAYKEYINVPRIKLPRPIVTGGEGIWSVIMKRRSVRDYGKDKTITVDILSQLLWASNGVSAVKFGIPLRTAPSAGALYPVETYVFANRVDGLSKGIYHYRVIDHELELIVGGDFAFSLRKAAIDQDMFVDAVCVFIWTAVIDRCRVRYGERAFRYIFLDAGHICQNLYLASTALGLFCCAVGAFFDDEVNTLLGIDGVTESVIYMATVGYEV